MAIISDKNLWKVVAAGSAALTGLAVQHLLRVGWKSWKNEEPPLIQSNEKIDWSNALVWTVASGAAIAVAQLVASRGVAAGWKEVTGEIPPA